MLRAQVCCRQAFKGMLELTMKPGGVCPATNLQ